ncbi:MAG TPA: HD-GYP domain-containing protein [Spongiibacteraceae bacterium]|jgi:HD-GYP domain-containing protein (c-di-GMP phosphodiesterase class II)
MTQKWIDINDLTLGMFVVKLGGAWVDHPFWKTRFLLANEEDLRLLQNAGLSRVCIDITKGGDASGHGLAPPASAEVNAKGSDIEPSLSVAPAIVTTQIDEQNQNVPMQEELHRAARICAKSKQAVAAMFQEARMGKAVDAESMQPLVEEISESVNRNPGALISLARLKSKDDYTYLHSVAVCALMIALARQLNLSEAETRQAGMAGLVHDVGKAMVPLDILNKPSKLTAVEFGAIKEHSLHGYRLLREGQGASSEMLDVCLHHHEKIDGTGYPEGLSDAGISQLAKMGAVCDVYDAITSNRSYKSGWDPSESLRRMAEWKGHFDPLIFQTFVKSLGIYPIGSLVRLESGRLAIVIEQHGKSLLVPIVKVFFSTKLRCHITHEILDLSRPQCADKIVGRESAEKWGLINLESLWVGDQRVGT